MKMSLGLRKINKFVNFTWTVTPKCSVLSIENISKQFSTAQCKQYSTGVSPKESYFESKVDGIKSSLIDNRETVHDLVKKENVFSLKSCSEDLNDVYSRYSKAEIKEAIEPLFSEKYKEQDSNKPSPEKLAHVHKILGESLPKLFVQPLDYSVYHPDVVFEDRIRNIRTVGLFSYIRQVALLRTVGHLKFAYVKFEILKITQHPEDSTIKVRWQIKGISAWRVMLTFWKFKLWKYKEMFEKTINWYDGFSTFYVNPEGQIVKHVADKMMPDSDTVTERKTIVNAAKLALIVGIIPKFSELNSIV